MVAPNNPKYCDCDRTLASIYSSHKKSTYFKDIKKLNIEPNLNFTFNLNLDSFDFDLELPTHSERVMDGH